MMESGRIFFDPSACHANMLFLGNGDSAFRGGGRSMMSIEETSKRRPFFSSSDDLFDESYYDDQSPEKKCRLTPDQVIKPYVSSTSSLIKQHHTFVSGILHF